MWEKPFPSDQFNWGYHCTCDLCFTNEHVSYYRCKYLINEVHDIHNNTFLLNYDLSCMPVNIVSIKEKFYVYACLAQTLQFHQLLVNSTLFTSGYLHLNFFSWKQNPEETRNDYGTLSYLKASSAFPHLFNNDLFNVNSSHYKAMKGRTKNEC